MEEKKSQTDDEKDRRINLDIIFRQWREKRQNDDEKDRRISVDVIFGQWRTRNVGLMKVTVRKFSEKKTK